MSLWTEAAFRTKVMDTLHKAVKDVDPTAKVTTTLDTDISTGAYEALGINGHHLHAAKAWKRYLDIIGISSYPNVFEPAPIRAQLIGQVIAELKAALPGKPAYVLETGYPVQQTRPSQSGAYYTEELQAEYVAKAFAAALEAGATGFFYTGIWGDDTLHHHIVGTAWGRWSAGRSMSSAFRILGPCMERGDVSILQQWNAAQGVHTALSYQPIEGFDHFGNHQAPTGSAWGLTDPEHKALRPAFQSLRDAIGKLTGLEEHLAAINNEISKRHGTTAT